VTKYQFLSDGWVTEARRLRAEAKDPGDLGEVASPVPVRVNLVVTEVPFQPAPLDAHVDTSSGYLEIDAGHLDHPDVTISMAYGTARSMFVAGDIQTVMQAFLGGRIKVDGDLSKLLDPRNGMWPGAFPASPVAQGPGGGQPSQGQLGGQRQPDEPGQPEGRQPGQPEQRQARAAAALALARRLQEITE
jgi:hypothetical protein